MTSSYIGCFCGDVQKYVNVHFTKDDDYYTAKIFRIIPGEELFREYKEIVTKKKYPSTYFIKDKEEVEEIRGNVYAEIKATLESSDR